MPLSPSQALPAHLRLGQVGEELAARYLMSQGFRILDRNWKSRYRHELDIVAFRDNRLHIVEVKTRSTNFLVDPQRAISLTKLQKLMQGASLYKKAHQLDFDTVIDGIRIVYRNDNDYDLTFLPNMHEGLAFERFRRSQPFN